MEAHLQQSPFPTSREQRIPFSPPTLWCMLGWDRGARLIVFILLSQLSLRHLSIPSPFSLSQIVGLLPSSSSPSLFDFLLISILCLLSFFFLFSSSSSSFCSYCKEDEPSSVERIVDVQQITQCARFFLVCNAISELRRLWFVSSRVE